MNEEASRALREAPQEVQRMMLQEVQVGALGSLGMQLAPKTKSNKYTEGWEEKGNS